MTIRDFIKRRVRLIHAAGFSGFLLMLASGFLVHDHRPAMPLFIIGGAVFIVGALALNFLVRCPKCRLPYGCTANRIAFTRGTRGAIDACPYCGARLDEPLGEPKG